MIVSAVTGPAFCGGPCANAFVATAPATAAGTTFRNLRRDSLLDLFGHDYFFSLKPAGIATSSAATVGDTDRISCDDVKTVPRWVTSPLGPIIFFASMPPMPPPVVGGG